MPIKVQNDLPARAILESENIFVMDEKRALSQDIRPLQILILNLMPIKEETETQLLRALSNTPLQVDCTLLMLSTHTSRNTSASHLNQFYVSFEEIRRQKYDGMIITGAPVENLEYEDVNYWEELKQIMEWTKVHVHSTFYICWGAHGAGQMLHLRFTCAGEPRQGFTITTESPSIRGTKSCLVFMNIRYCITRCLW